MNKDPDDIGWSIMIGIFILIGVLIPMSLLIFGFISYNNNKRIFGKIKSITLMPDSSDTIKSFSYLPTLSSSSSSLSSSKMPIKHS
ncbi:hypothetical protein DERP_009758 [Dermatophagoides pteronyssinus]|uniref:Uncharacterized protein n=1 Tax=Dermatophagoides pteronyssinus TaxID=6956 RepID=A0ABQ8IR35_DERPT|nr:hypothetical protein DERP_009758 [Dermatophagoides pteronyssinus]